MRRKIMLIALSVAPLLAACVPPKILVQQEAVGSRSVKYVIQASQVGEQQHLYDFYIRVCDVAGAKETNCNETLVLQNVSSEPIE